MPSQHNKQIPKDNSRSLNKQCLFQEENCQQYQASIIQKFNVIQHGINFLVPHIWYQELCHLNFKIKQLQNLILPPFQIKQILTIYGLIQQQASYKNHFHIINEQLSSILTNINFINIEIYRGIKINRFYHNHQGFSWKVINPHLWRMIQQKKQQNRKQCIYSLSIFIQQEFIKQNKIEISRGLKRHKKENKTTILFRNKFYELKERALNKYIMQNLLIGKQKLVQLILASNEKKVQFNAYFDVKLKIKNLILSLKKIFNFNEETFKVYKGTSAKEQITRMTTFQILGQNSTLLVLFPNLEILKQKFQLMKLSFENYLKSNIVQKAYLKIDSKECQNKFNHHNINKMSMPLSQLYGHFKLIQKEVAKNKWNNIIKQSQIFLKEGFKKKISYAYQKNHNKKSFQTQQQVIFNQSDESAQNSRNIRSISTYECTPLSWHSDQPYTANQNLKTFKEKIKIRRKKNKIITNLQRDRLIKGKLQYQLFKQVSNQEQKYFRSIAKQSIFNEKDLIHISKPIHNQQLYFQNQLQKLIQYFQKSLQATQLSKDLSEEINLQKQQLQKLTRQKMKEEQIITIVDNQLQMDLQRDKKYYFDKEQQTILSKKKKIIHSRTSHLPSSRKSQKVEGEEEIISIQTQTEQIQFFSDEQHMLDEDQQVR